MKRVAPANEQLPHHAGSYRARVTIDPNQFRKGAPLCRDAVVPVHRPRLRKVDNVHIGQAELRTYATLLWILKTLVIGYVLVSLSTKGGIAGVRCVFTLSSILICKINACHNA